MLCLLVLFGLPYIIIGRLLRKDGREYGIYFSFRSCKKWGISQRRVQKLCEENRIKGIAKFSYMLLIPKDADKPKDSRKK